MKHNVILFLILIFVEVHGSRMKIDTDSWGTGSHQKFVAAVDLVDVQGRFRLRDKQSSLARSDDGNLTDIVANEGKNTEEDASKGGDMRDIIIICLGCICGLAALLVTYLVLQKLRERKRRRQVLISRNASHAREVEEMASQNISADSAKKNRVTDKEAQHSMTKSEDLLRLTHTVSHPTSTSDSLSQNERSPTPAENSLNDDVPDHPFQSRSVSDSSGVLTGNEAQGPRIMESPSTTLPALIERNARRYGILEAPVSEKHDFLVQKACLEARLHEKSGADAFPSVVPIVETGTLDDDFVMDAMSLESRMHQNL